MEAFDLEKIDFMEKAMIERMVKDKSIRIFVMSWTGSTVPYGAEIDGQKITSAQGGDIKGETSGKVGLYAWFVRNGGETKRAQVWLVGITGAGKKVFDPDGNECEEIDEKGRELLAAKLGRATYPESVPLPEASVAKSTTAPVNSRLSFPRRLVGYLPNFHRNKL